MPQIVLEDKNKTPHNYIGHSQRQLKHNAIGTNHRSVPEYNKACKAFKRWAKLRVRSWQVKSSCASSSYYSGCAGLCLSKAGLPNGFGEYRETPIQFASKMEEYVKTNLVNTTGGCCGSTPAHIAAPKPRRIVVQKAMLRLSGINAVAIPEAGFLQDWRKANVAGSSRFREIISKGDNEGALEVVREQVASGANVVNVNMDEPLLNSKTKIKEFVNLIDSEPDVSKAPLTIDSSDWTTLTAGARCTQGRCIINSISLKDGEHSFLEKSQEVLMCEGVPVTIAFDEQGKPTLPKKKKAANMQKSSQTSEKKLCLIQTRSLLPPESRTLL
ncbi:dihydropteroate synthase [Candidatus Hodgkinia cicadicola]